MKASPKLFTREFLALNLILAASFCNVSVFYSFYHYLGAIGIPVAWRGFLVGLEPMSAFVLRLLVLPWLHVRNAFTVLAVSLVLLVFVSCSYLWVVTTPLMIVLRIVHGAVFVLLTSAVVALIVQFIPQEKSGQGFGTVSVATMIPYAVIPPLTEALLPHVRSEAVVYAGVSCFSLASLVLLAVFRSRFRLIFDQMDASLMRRPRLREIRENFRRRTVCVLLAAGLLIYLVHATVFYFIKDLALQNGIGDVGLFFTISMVTMIAVRAFGSVLFDKMNKWWLFRLGTGVLMLTIFFLPQTADRISFYLLAGIYGLAMGVILPMMNALLFVASPPALRGLNTNMTLFTLDAGYFLMPYLGGIMVACGVGFGGLFFSGAGFALLALLLGWGNRSASAEERN